MRTLKNKFRKRHSVNRLPLVAMIFLTLFLTVTPPAPAIAQCCGNQATETTLLGFKAADLAQLGVIGSLISSVLTVVQYLQNTLFPQGFSSVSAAVVGSSTLQAKGNANNTNALMQSNWQGIWNGQVAALQQDATAPDQSTACPMIADAQNYNTLQDAIIKSGRQETALHAGECKTGATPVACAQQILGQLCKLGMLPTVSTGSYGQYISQMGCSSDSNFTDAAVSSWYNCGPIGMAVPDNVTIDSKTGNLDFSNITKGNGDCRTDGRCFAAAVLHCELMALENPADTPPYGTSAPVTQQITAQIVKDLTITSHKLDSFHQCMQDIGYRSICGPNASSVAIAAVGGTANCSQLQQDACKKLGTAPAAGASTGTGGDGQGVGIMTPDIQSCMSGNTGLSLAERDRDTLFAPCLDTNYATNIAPSMKTNDEAQRDVNTCRQKLSEFYRSMRQCNGVRFSGSAQGVEQ